jgi:hypothetical protein
MLKPTYAVFTFILLAGIATCSLTLFPSESPNPGADAQKQLDAPSNSLSQEPDGSKVGQQSTGEQVVARLVKIEELLDAISKKEAAPPAENGGGIADAIREQTDSIKNINDAIRARKDAENTPVVIIPPADSTNSAGGSGWGHYFLIAMLLVIFPSFLFGFGYFAENYWAETRAAKYSLRAVASGLALVSISIGTIVTIKDLTILHVTYAPQSGGQSESQSQSQQGRPQIQTVIINIPESRQRSIRLDCGRPKAPEENSGENREGNEMRIGPFPIGWANPEDNKDGNPDVIKAFELTRESLTKVAQLIRQQVSPQKNLVGLTLIGSFDKRPLGPGLRKKYGENAGLAMARAIWVKDQFAKQGKLIRETQMVVMTAGPGHTELQANGQVIRLDQTVQQDAGDQDRAVQVCATWEESP